MEPNRLVKLTDVSMAYKKSQVLRDVSFVITGGEVVGLVGANGAGKTTLLKCMLGLLRFQSGQIEMAGQMAHCGADLKHIAFVSDTPVFYPFLTVKQHLALTGRLYGGHFTDGQLDNVLDHVGLLNVATKPTGTLSRGMAQRLAWAHCMVSSAKVVLMDEPTSALDPLGVADLRGVVQEMAAGGRAVLFSSHTINEVERLCTRVLFLKNGLCSEVATPEIGPSSNRYEITTKPGRAIDLLKLGAFAVDIEEDGSEVRFTTKQHLELHQVSEMLHQAGVTALSIRRQTQSLEDLFTKTIESGTHD